MTGKDAFTEEEWHTLREGPAIAGMLVLTAESGGSFRESWAMAKEYAEAKQQHGESELLDSIVAEKPEFDRHKYSSPQELQSSGLDAIRGAVSILESKATPEDVDAYRNFALAVAQRVAGAHKEHGQAVSPNEQAALDQIAETLGAKS